MKLAPLVATPVFCVAMLLAASGCSEPVDHDNDPATPARSMRAGEIELWANREAERAASEAEADAERTRAEIARATRAAERQLAQIDAQQEQIRAEIVAAAEEQVEGLVLAASARADERSARLADVRAEAEGAIARIDERLGLVKAVVSDPAVAGAIGGVPGGNVALGLVGLALGYGAARRGKANEDRAWDESQRNAEIESLRRQQAELIARLTVAAAKPASGGAA